MKPPKKASDSSVRAGKRGKNLPHEILSIMLLGSAVFVTAALLTYHASDPSLFSSRNAVCSAPSIGPLYGVSTRFR